MSTHFCTSALKKVVRTCVLNAVGGVPFPQLLVVSLNNNQSIQLYQKFGHLFFFFIGGLWELFINCSPKWEVVENFFGKTGHNQTDPVEKPQSWNEFLYFSSGVNIPGWPSQGKCMRNTEMPNKVVSSTEGKKKERKKGSNQLKRCYFLSLFHITSLWTWQFAINDFITICSRDLCRSCGICMWNSICHFISIYWG